MKVKMRVRVKMRHDTLILSAERRAEFDAVDGGGRCGKWCIWNRHSGKMKSADLCVDYFEAHQTMRPTKSCSEKKKKEQVIKEQEKNQPILIVWENCKKRVALGFPF